MKASLSLVVLLALGACTHWVTTPAYGPRSEVGRTLVGAPQIEEVTTANMSAGFSGATTSNGYGSTYGVGGLSGGAATVKRTHCVQQAQVDYVQPVNFEVTQSSRALDVAGSIILGVIGLAVVEGASNKYNSDLQFYNMDPSFFSMPSQPTGAYVAGGAMMVGAGAWLIYSLTSLPKGPPPVSAPQERRWTETTYVEAQGCGLVPADRAPAPVPGQP